MSGQTKEILFEIQDLNKYFVLDKRNTLKAVNHVSLTIHKGETVGIVGESGCGKTTLGRTIKRLYRATSGKVLYKGQDIFSMNKAQAHQYAKNVQMIFQDPYSSLDHRMMVREIIREGMLNHDICKGDRAAQDKRIGDLLQMVGLNAEHADRFPHEFSGGQRQRIGIARALSLNPAFIVADEPVSALDVSIQAQIINLLAQLQRELELTVLFISHDLRVVRHITHRVMVMYLGSNVEVGPTEAIFQHPAHPYTQVLTKAAPKLDPLNRQRDYAIEGEPPSPIHTPTGGQFHPRCPYCTDKCRSEVPELKEIAPGHLCACHYPL